MIVTQHELQPEDVVEINPGVIKRCLGNQPVIARIKSIEGDKVEVVYNFFGDRAIVLSDDCKFKSGYRTQLVRD